jgi:aspartyl aminopeptidase
MRTLTLRFFKTHYYGGIKKYQWTTIPLALHGVIFRADGTKVEVRVGEDEGDPQFCVTDLLPHLAREQMKKADGGSRRGREPQRAHRRAARFRDDKASELVKLAILNLLNEKYGITEADFLSAELTMVPAAKPVDIGFLTARSSALTAMMTRSCAYPAATALLDCGRGRSTPASVSLPIRRR